MAIDQLVQDILEKENKGDLPCYLCGDEIGQLGDKLGFFPTDTGFELAHKKCIESLKRAAKKKHNG